MLGEIWRFLVVGGLGTATNLAVFYGLVDVGTTPPLPGATAAFAVAVTQNYLLNELWTFTADRTGEVSGGRYGRFVAFSLMSLAVNLAVLQFLVTRFVFPLLVIPQAVGILAATALNFLSSRFLVFR